jgi:hypothetical protein
MTYPIARRKYFLTSDILLIYSMGSNAMLSEDRLNICFKVHDGRWIIAHSRMPSHIKFMQG